MKISDITVKIFDGIEKIPRDEWDSVYPPTLEGYNYFRSIDESSFAGIKTHYIMAYRKLVPVAAAPFFSMSYPLESTLEGSLKIIAERLRVVFPNILTLRALVCGSIACEGRIGIRDPKANEVLKAILRGMGSIARKEHVSILAFKDFSVFQSQILDSLAGEGFYRINSYPSASITIDFSSFDEYMKTLSRSTRKDLKRKFRRAEIHPRIEVDVVDNVDSILDDVYFLYLQTFHRAEFHFEKVPMDFFEKVAKNMKGTAKFFLWRIGDRLAAFNLCLVHGGALMDEYVGFDYMLIHKYPLYFITFRDIIEWCIKNGIRRYETGALVYEPKRRLDCKFVPNYIYLKHANVLINPFFKLMCAVLKPDNFDKELREMKQKGII